jgi:DNA replication and repair protein RecF
MAKSHAFKADLLEAWNDQLVRYAQDIFEKRKLFIKNFLPLFQNYYYLLSNDQQTISLEYNSQLSEDSLDNLLQNALQKDRMVQHTTVGIHKDDLVFNLSQLAIKRLGSQGQQKTFLLALKLAQYQHIGQSSGIKPILLLDDIFDKLDRERVQNLIKIITEEKFGQTFITDTNEERLNEAISKFTLDYKMFTFGKENQEISNQ